MKCKNFTWSENIYICAGGVRYDLHNDYDFNGFSYSVQSRSLVLTWTRCDKEWVSKQLAERIRIEISEVDYLKVVPREPEMPFSEDECLDSFGYDCDEVWAEGQFWTDAPPDPEWRWSFEFESGAEIIVGGAEAQVVIVARLDT